MCHNNSNTNNTHTNTNSNLNYASSNPLHCQQYMTNLDKYHAIIRISCHILLWCKFSPQSTLEITNMVTPKLFRCVIMTYINCLICKQQTQCIAVYAAMLPRKLCVLKYMHVILSVPLTDRHTDRKLWDRPNRPKNPKKSNEVCLSV